MVVAAIIRPETVNLTGSLEIIQGATYFLVLQAKDIDGAFVNLTGATLACQFRTSALPSGVTTGCPTPTLYVHTALEGKVSLLLLNLQTTQVDGQAMSGAWDLEATLADGNRYRLFQGTWTRDALQVTRKYNS